MARGTNLATILNIINMMRGSSAQSKRQNLQNELLQKQIATMPSAEEAQLGRTNIELRQVMEDAAKGYPVTTPPSLEPGAREFFEKGGFGESGEQLEPFSKTITDYGEFTRKKQINEVLRAFEEKEDIKRKLKPIKFPKEPGLFSYKYGEGVIDPTTKEDIRKPIKLDKPEKQFKPDWKTVNDPKSPTGYSYVNTNTKDIIKNAIAPSSTGLPGLRKSKGALAEAKAEEILFLGDARLETEEARAELFGERTIDIRRKGRAGAFKQAQELSKNFVGTDGKPVPLGLASAGIREFIKTGRVIKALESIKPKGNILGQEIKPPTQKDILQYANKLQGLYKIRNEDGSVRDLTPKEAQNASKTAFSGVAPPDNFVQRDTIREVLVRSAGAAKLVTDLKQQLSDLNAVQTLYTPDMVGYVPGFKGWLSRKTHAGIDPTFENFRVKVQAFFTTFLKSLSGSQVTKYEEMRIKQIVPTEYDHPDVFNAKLSALRDILGRHLRVNLKTLEDIGYTGMGEMIQGVDRLMAGEDIVAQPVYKEDIVREKRRRAGQ